MPCPHCARSAAAELPGRTALGYRASAAKGCRRSSNERTGTPPNRLQVPSDMVLLVVLRRLCYKPIFRDLAEIYLTRGFVFTHDTDLW